MDEATRPVGETDPWQQPWQPRQPEQPQQPSPPPWQQAQPAWQQPAPGPQTGWHQPDPWAPREPAGNPVAVWSWVLAVPCAVLGLVFGVLGLSRAKRRGGAGQTHAVVGVVLSSLVVLVCLVAVPVGAFGWLLSETGGTEGGDGTVASLTDQEQDYLDGIGDDTYYAYSDATLLLMGQDFCDALDGGAAPPQADEQLVDDWADAGLTLDEAYEVESSATSALCPAHADDFSAWDPEETDGGGGSQVLDPTSAEPWQA